LRKSKAEKLKGEAQSCWVKQTLSRLPLIMLDPCGQSELEVSCGITHLLDRVPYSRDQTPRLLLNLFRQAICAASIRERMQGHTCYVHCRKHLLVKQLHNSTMSHASLYYTL